MDALKTSDLCDALDGIEACSTQFRSFGRRRMFHGVIRTVRCFEDIVLIRQRVNERHDGGVLVVDAGGSLNRAIFGDSMAALMLRNGWIGAIIFGAVRDVAEIDEMDIGVKALGTVARRGEKTGGGEADVPVSFGGVAFVPGRYVVADEDGVIALPEGMAPSDIDTRAVAAAGYSTP
jgi:regulator of ribonuclease activity A